jgi:hypothetical protein
LRPRAAVTEASEFHERMLNPDALAPSAKEINEFYNRFFYHAAELLGNERFEQMFGVRRVSRWTSSIRRSMRAWPRR